MWAFSHGEADGPETCISSFALFSTEMSAMPISDRKTSELFWHALDGESVLKALASQVGGLTQDVAAQRLALYGPNRLPPPKKQIFDCLPFGS